MPEAQVLHLLAEGELEILGRITGASNATLYASVQLDGVSTGCVYKPISGEKPLWDFPSRTLGLRETASYLVSAHGGLDVVPPTVLRDGPFGPGSLQLWVNAPDGDPDGTGDSPGEESREESGEESDEESDGQAGDRSGARTSADEPDGGGAGRGRRTGLGGMPLTVEPVLGEPGAGVVDVCSPAALPPDWKPVLNAEDAAGDPVVLAHADDPGLRRIALFDVVVNNTDRKGGHILRGRDNRLYGVDHGLTFNLDDKLRTVLWGWSGERLGAEAAELLERLVTDLTADGELRAALAALLDDAEIDRTARRAAQLLRRGRFPKPPGDWHAIPWPPF